MNEVERLRFLMCVTRTPAEIEADERFGYDSTAVLATVANGQKRWFVVLQVEYENGSPSVVYGIGLNKRGDIGRDRRRLPISMIEAKRGWNGGPIEAREKKPRSRRTSVGAVMRPVIDQERLEAVRHQAKIDRQRMLEQSGVIGAIAVVEDVWGDRKKIVVTDAAVINDGTLFINGVSGNVLNKDGTPGKRRARAKLGKFEIIEYPKKSVDRDIASE